MFLSFWINTIGFSDEIDAKVVSVVLEDLSYVDENGDPDHVPLIVKKMETLSANKEELELEEVERRFEKINVHDQVTTWKQNKR